jgi:hypothetical protein
MAAANLPFSPIDPKLLIPMVNKLLVGIEEMAQKISIKVKDVKTYQRQCLRLSERINRVSTYLNSHEFKQRVYPYSDTLKQTLEGFNKFLDDCFKYVSLFVDMGWLKKIVNVIEHTEQFQELNDQLERFVWELTMGININLSDRKQQDEQDQIEDSKVILTTIKKNQTVLQPNDGQIDDWAKAIINHLNQLKSSTKPKTRSTISPSPDISQPRSKGLVPDVSQSRSNGPSTIQNHSSVHEPRDIGVIVSSRPPNNIFVNGTWSLRYSQHGTWYGPFKQQITFDSNSNTLVGNGKSNFGQFILKGTFSKDTNRIDIIQTYTYATGNPLLNTGHAVKYQLTWNKDKGIFEGIHYMPNSLTMTMTQVGKIEMSIGDEAA